MIVKNESKIIERCLNKVKDIVDCISICDTGSTDNTKEIIEQFMQKNNIPGKVHQHKWKNFGYNRTLSAQAARHVLQELHFSLANTYFLLLDADMLLEIEPDFSKEALTASCYMVLQKGGDTSWYNKRLLRASFPWCCLGVTHEFWAFPLPDYKIEEVCLGTLWINDQGDGGCKSDKFERDLKLLKQGLKDEPANSRYMFYLAGTYKNLEDWNQACKWYKAHIAASEWEEEIWYSKLMLGEIFEHQGFWDQALYWYLEAYRSHPCRAEPLQKISQYYRLKGKNHLAYLFAKQGSSIPYPKNDVLFVTDSVYHYRFDEEISIAAYYIPACREEGFQAADRLAHKKNIPQDVKDQTFRNLLFYVQPLQNGNFYTLGEQQHLLAGSKVEQKGEDNDQLPFIKEKEIDTPFSFQSNIINQINKETGEGQRIFPENIGYDFSRFRHSVAPIKVAKGYLMLIYELIDDEKVLHRFLYLDQNYNLKQMSRPFIFKQKGNECCIGLALNDSGEKCLISIEIDKNVWNYSIDLKELYSLLKPLP